MNQKNKVLRNHPFDNPEYLQQTDVGEKAQSGWLAGLSP